MPLGINITFCIGSETHGPTFAFNIVTKNSRFVFVYPIISHYEQQLERKYLAADENYSHTNVIFLYASITLLRKENFTISLVRHSIYEEHHPEAIITETSPRSFLNFRKLSLCNYFMAMYLINSL